MFNGDKDHSTQTLLFLSQVHPVSLFQCSLPTSSSSATGTAHPPQKKKPHTASHVMSLIPLITQHADVVVR